MVRQKKSIKATKKADEKVSSLLKELLDQVQSKNQPDSDRQ